jgi:hypothetical protein
MEPGELFRAMSSRRAPGTAEEFRLRGIECWADIYQLPWVNEQAALAEQIVLRAQLERATRALDAACNREPAPPAISDAQFDNALARLANLRMQQTLIQIVISELAHETWGEDSPLHDVYKTHAGHVDECWLELRRLQRALPREYVPARATGRRARSAERPSNCITRRSGELRGGREEPVAGRASTVEPNSAKQAAQLSGKIGSEEPTATPYGRVSVWDTPAATEPRAPANGGACLIGAAPLQSRLCFDPKPVRKAHTRSHAEFRSRPPRPSRSSPHLRVQQFQAAGPGGACLRQAA